VLVALVWGLLLFTVLFSGKSLRSGPQKIITFVRKLPSQECDTERMLDSYRPGFPYLIREELSLLRFSGAAYGAVTPKKEDLFSI
jgi:hypothetical protein